MTEILKKLIETAPTKRCGKFINFMFVSNGEYDGFWGKNGYDSMIIFGYDLELEKYVKITDYADVFNIYRLNGNNSFSLDIPTEYGIPRIWFSTPIRIDNELDISSVVGEIVKKEHI